MIYNGNRTEWSPIRSVIIRVIEYDYRPNWTTRSPVNHNHYNFRADKCIPFSLSIVINSSILEIPQFCRVSGCCYGCCDKFCDWRIKLSALNMIG